MPRVEVRVANRHFFCDAPHILLVFRAWRFFHSPANLHCALTSLANIAKEGGGEGAAWHKAHGIVLTLVILCIIRRNLRRLCRDITRAIGLEPTLAIHRQSVVQTTTVRRRDDQEPDPSIRIVDAAIALGDAEEDVRIAKTRTSPKRS